MTKEPSEAAKRKACELVNAAANYNLYTIETAASSGNAGIRALALHLDEVDKELRACFGAGIDAVTKGPLGRFVLPNPPDLLVGMLYDMGCNVTANEMRAELAKYGLTIAPKD